MSRPDLKFDMTGDVVHMHFGGRRLDVDFSSREYRLPADRDLRSHLCMMLLAAFEEGVNVGANAARKRVRDALEIKDA